MKVNFSPASSNCLARSAVRLSTVSSTPWPASATADEKTPIHARRTKLSFGLILLPFVILHGHIFIIRRPRDRAFHARRMTHDPKAAAGIRRACEHQSVVVNEHVVGVAGIRVYPAKHRRDEMADGLRRVRIGNVDGPEAGILPGAENNISLNHSFDIVNTKAPARPVGRTKSVQGEPESRNLHRIFLVAHVNDVHVTERTMFGTD